MSHNLEQFINRYRELGIDQQIDYDKFYLYSLITSKSKTFSSIVRSSGRSLRSHVCRLQAANV